VTCSRIVRIRMDDSDRGADRERTQAGLMGPMHTVALGRESRYRLTRGRPECGLRLFEPRSTARRIPLAR
jgi:hypothetical protein